MKDKWIEKFNERLGDYQLPVDIPDWEEFISGANAKKRKPFPWYIPLMAGAAAALALLLLLPMGRRSGQDVEPCLIAEAVPSLIQPSEGLLQGANPLPDIHRRMVPTSALTASSPTPETPASTGTTASSETPASTATPATNPDATTKDDTTADAGKPQVTLPDVAANDTPDTPAVAVTGQGRGDTYGEWDDDSDRISHRRSRIFSFNLHAGNILPGGGGGDMADATPMSYLTANGKLNYGRVWDTNDIGAKPGGLDANLLMNLAAGVPQSALYEAATSLAASPSEWSCDLPVKAGLGVHIGLTPVIGLESGLTYSYHRAQLIRVYTEGVMQGNGLQYRLHYLGIPLRLSAGFEPVERLRVYGIAGGELQMLATGETVGTGSQKTVSKVDGHPLQYALTAATGLDLSLTRHLSLYAEPGLAWYLKIPENLPSYYREHPLSFDLQFGLRFSFR